MKIKFNWGTGILLTFVLFMVSVILQVIFYMNTDVDLVTDNYYDKEMIYEDHISKINNTSALSGSLIIEYSDNNITLNFPDEQAGRINGDVLFYRPSDPSKDFTVNITPDEKGYQKINTSDISRGYWKLKVNWMADQVPYYSEKSLLIN
jgi:hypothetical protein